MRIRDLLNKNFGTRMSIASRRMDFIVLVLLALSACAGPQVSAAPGVAETRLDGYIANARQSSIAWIDNESLLFVGAKPGVFEPPVPGGGRPFTRFLFRWNTRTGDVSTIAEQGEYGSICYDRGYVVYRARIEGRLIVREGLLGSERTVPELLDPERYGRNPFTCREYSKVQFREMYGNTAQPLREEHGYWMYKKDAQLRDNVVFVSTANGGRREIATPMFGTIYDPRWFEFAQSYVFLQFRFSYDTREPVPGKFWTLKPSGEVQEFEIPFGPWLGGGHGVRALQSGFFLWGQNSLEQASGGYVLRDGRVERIIEGHIFDSAVSPNGCKVAMSIRVGDTVGSSVPDMRLVDLCPARYGLRNA